MSTSPASLADALGALPVLVSAVRVEKGCAPLVEYPEGSRPTSTVCLSGEGHTGFGENVAFSEAEHDRFAAETERRLAGSLGARARANEFAWCGCPPYERAALEAALIDLAMRQAGLSLSDLTGKSEGRLRFVVSFAVCADPRARIRQLRANGCEGDLKIDVDPSWNEETRRALAGESGIAILDFKGRGDAELARVWAALCPDAIFEDPPAETSHRHIARDAELADAVTVAAAAQRHESINLKAPRMGGPLELLRGLERFAQISDATDTTVDRAAYDRAVYVGGMFEVGVGRTQARQLAALFCPGGPNDLAPIERPCAEASPMLVRLDTPGFGAAP